MLKGRRVSRRLIYRIIRTKYMGVWYRSKGRKYNWFILRRTKKDRRRRFSLFKPRAMKLIGSGRTTLFASGLNACYPPDRDKIAKINMNYRYGLRQEVLRRDQFRCQCCSIDVLDTGIRYETHHVCPVQFGGKSQPGNLKLLCGPCHLLISQAVASKNEDNMYPFISQGLLSLTP